MAEAIDAIMDEASSQGSWSVVVEEGLSDLARATQAIGSALYQSDLVSSSSGGPSTITSVPTSIQTIRWSGYLEQLHEMGFEDEDDAAIEILERLAAANIGCEESPEIEIDRVVNELLERRG